RRLFRGPANGGGDAAAIFEQAPLVLRCKAHIGKTGEMQRRPEAVAAMRKIVTRDGGAQSWIQTAENNIQAWSEDIRFVAGQTNRLFSFHFEPLGCCLGAG